MTPPFMAQGMVQGIRDAHNLAWKLARVLAGSSRDKLLDTYQVERRPHVEATTRAAIALGRVICERDPERAKARDKALIAEQGDRVPTTIRQNMIPGLSTGLLAETCPGAGALFPQPTVRNSSTGRSGLLDDMTGSRVRLVTSTTLTEHESVELDRRLAGLDGCLVSVGRSQPAGAPVINVSEMAGCLTAWMDGLGRSFAIVRPDHYVYSTAATAVEALHQLDSLSAALQTT
jgi:3-(3-hydroxy-phenyl)propionate hydroxylase